MVVAAAAATIPGAHRLSTAERLAESGDPRAGDLARLVAQQRVNLARVIGELSRLGGPGAAGNLARWAGDGTLRIADRITALRALVAMGDERAPELRDQIRLAGNRRELAAMPDPDLVPETDLDRLLTNLA